MIRFGLLKWAVLGIYLAIFPDHFHLTFPSSPDNAEVVIVIMSDSNGKPYFEYDMGDTFAAWEVKTSTGEKHLIIAKAYACAKVIAERDFPDYEELSLLASENRTHTKYKRTIVDET